MKNKFLTIAAIAGMSLMTSGCGVYVVDAGETGVVKTNGKISEEVLSSGMHFVTPFISEVISVDNKIKRYENTSPAYTKDVQQAEIDYVLNYNLQPSASAQILIDVGSDYESKLIPQVMNAQLKNVVGRWNAIDLIANREEATTQIATGVSRELEKYGLIVRNIELTDIAYQPQFEKAVEDKVTAVQRAEEAKNNTVRVQEEANQRIIAAEADAKAMRIKTEALKQSQSLVEYEAIMKWNGVLPQYMLGGATPFINLNK